MISKTIIRKKCEQRYCNGGGALSVKAICLQKNTSQINSTS